MGFRSKTILFLILPGLFSANAIAADPSSSGTDGSSTQAAVGDSGSTTTGSGSNAINMSTPCAGGGTRSVTGTYDPSSGALDITATMDACVLRDGETITGKMTTNGLLQAVSSGFTMDLNSVVNTSLVRPDGSTVTRACTIGKNGTFDMSTKTFTGTITHDKCTATGVVREYEGIVEHLLRNAITEDETGGNNPNTRLLPPQPNEPLGWLPPEQRPLHSLFGAPGATTAGSEAVH
jgi:hypothetical protein